MLIESKEDPGARAQAWAVELFQKAFPGRTDVRLVIVGARYVRDYEIECVDAGPSRIPPSRSHSARAGTEWWRGRRAVCMARPCQAPHRSGRAVA